jgi:hypothetical protein
LWIGCKSWICDANLVRRYVKEGLKERDVARLAINRTVQDYDQRVAQARPAHDLDGRAPVAKDSDLTGRHLRNKG